MLLALAFLLADTLARPLGGLPPGVTDGYAATVRGEAFGYHSAHPTDRSSLLVRSLDSTNAAEWTSAPVATGVKGMRRIAFLAAMDVVDEGLKPVTFWMTVNGRHRLRLPQPRSAAGAWRIETSGGIALDFRRLLIDKFGDVHGVFTVELSEELAPAGEPVTLRVQGESVGRRSWFILYTVSMRPTVGAHPEQMLVRDGGMLMQTVRLDAWNPFEEVPVSVEVDGTPRLQTRLEAGSAVVRVNVPAVTEARFAAIVVTTPTARAEFPSVRLEPVTRREIHLVPHSHLDIGYTDVHSRVRDKHWQGLDSALVYIERSRSNPDEARFRWNVEGLWALQEYVETRPAADVARLMDAVRRGDVAIAGLYANLMTGLSGGEELIRLLDYARHLRSAYGIDVTTTMTSDVPGFTWGMVPALSQSGIRYLSSGPNYMPGPGQDGDRIGWTLAAWGDRPFWWIGPSGRDSVLVMTAGKGYSWVGGWPRGRLTVADAGVMSGYMDELRAKDYPYEIVQVRYAIGGDNGFPDAQLADEVIRWNERFESPRLVISTLPRLFEAFETRYGDRIPRIRGDLTGYWEDGALSSTREQVMNRAAAARLVQAATLASIRRILLAKTDLDAAWRFALLWDEHTWGADRSISEPDAPDVLEQWRLKQRFALEADSSSRALLAAASRSSAKAPGVDVWNTHDFELAGVHTIPDSLSRAGDRVEDSARRPVPSQQLRDGSLAVLAELQPMGATRLTVARGAATVPGGEPARAAGDSLWNGLVSVRIDPATGGVASVRRQGRELVDGSKGGWNRYLYLLGRDTTKAVDASATTIEVLDDGPLVATLRVTSRAAGTVSLVREVTLHAGSDAVHLVTRLDKAAVREKEAVHFAFPLAVPGGTVRMEQGWAIVRPDIDQADGANRNLYPVQRWLDASNQEFGITLVTPDLPLWQLGGLTAESFMQPDGRQVWMRRSLPGTNLVAYAMNNYWHTNFKADQPGPVTFRVTLVPHGPFDAAAATRAGLAASEPPVVTRAGPGPGAEPLFTLDDPRVVVSSVTPTADGTGYLVRLWNPGRSAVRVGLRWGAGREPAAWLSSPDEDRRVPAPPRIEVPALGSVSVRIEPVR